MSTAPGAVDVEPALSRIRAAGTATLGVVVAGVIIAIASAQAFGLFYGVENRLLGDSPRVPTAGPAVDRIVTEQQSSGLTCRVEPELTDRVVFQYGPGGAEGGSAAVLTFA